MRVHNNVERSVFTSMQIPFWMSGDLFSADLNPRWRRPPAPPLDTSCDTLVFQQIDLDYYLGNCSAESTFFLHVCFGKSTLRGKDQIWPLIKANAPSNLNTYNLFLCVWVLLSPYGT